MAGRLAYKYFADVDRPVTIRGHSMVLASHGRYPPFALAKNSYEAETTRLFESLLNPGMVIMDLGAHVGYFSLLAARRTGPNGKVYAFEPEPQNYELLLRNVEANGYTNVVATRKVVSNKVGSGTLFITGLDSGRHSTYHHGLPERGSVPVETTTVDAFLEMEGWPHIDLVKLDVEGAEMDVLQGMNQLLDKSQDLKLILEFSPSLLRSAGADPLHFLEELVARDFEVACIAPGDGPSVMQGKDRASLVNKLLKSEGSLNLFCSKR